MAVEGRLESSVEAAELSAMPAEREDQMAAAVVAEAANDYSKKRPKMTPITAVAASSDYVAVDQVVVLPGERWISQYYLADFVNYSTYC